MRVSVLGLAVVALAASSCGAGEPVVTVERTDSAGVAVVTSVGQDRPAPFSLEREWAVGGVEDGLELGELRPWHVAADGAGRVHVLDTQSNRVLVLGPAGELIETLGRAGSGPGELASPVSIAVGEDGVVGVWDYGRGGLVRWRNGAALPVERVEAGFWGPDVAVWSGGVAFVARSPDDPSAQRLVVSDSSGSRVAAELQAIPQRPAEFPTCGIRGIPVSPLFAPELNWAVMGDRILASTSAAYEIRVLSLAPGPGDNALRLESIWRRSLPPRPATDALALREVGDGLRIPVADCTVPPAEVVRGRGVAEVIPALRRLEVDRQGRAWVLRGGVADEPGVVDILDSTGAYLGTLSGDVPVPAAYPAPDRVVGIQMDSDGIPFLVSSRIRPR